MATFVLYNDQPANNRLTAFACTNVSPLSPHDRILSMMESRLGGRSVLITGAALRIGRALALACAYAGADVVIHYHHHETEAQQLRDEILEIGRSTWIFQADLAAPAEAAGLVERAASVTSLYALVNNAAIFENLGVEHTTAADWDRHMAINLNAPFLLSQHFARLIPAGGSGRIVNLLDWRALRPGTDHFPYTISKAALSALTRILARALAPKITVNGLALGAILPPTDGEASSHILEAVPLQAWGGTGAVSQALIYLLSEAAYITGQILHVDGGRHLV